MIPKCSNFAHLYSDPPGENLGCSAFPMGIPDDILSGRVSHRIPYKGDHGFRYEPIFSDPVEPGELEPAGADEVLPP